MVRTILRKLAELLWLMSAVHALYVLLAGADAGWPAVLAGGVSRFFILPDHGWLGFIGLSVAIAAASETSQAWFELQALQAAPLSTPISAVQAPQFPKTGRFLFSAAELKMPLSYTGWMVARHRGRTRDGRIATGERERSAGPSAALRSTATDGRALRGLPSGRLAAHAATLSALGGPDARHPR